jgi:hypothetical protein
MLSRKISAFVRVTALLSLCLCALPAISAEPTSVKGLVLWLSADDVDADGAADSAASGTRIPAWIDKSGLGNHLKQPSAERQPTRRVDAIGGKATLRFDGGDCLELAKVAGLDAGDQPFYAVFVMKAAMAGSPANPRLLDLRGDDFEKKEPRRGFWVGYQNNGRNRLGIAYGDEGEAASVAWNGKPNLLEVVYEGRGRWAQYLNGKLDGRGTFGNRTFLGFQKPIRLAIGQHAGITPANTFYRGDLAEVLLYNRVPAPEEQNALGVHLSRKYGIETTYGPLPRFEKDVAPILAQHCQKCHGGRKQEAKLDLRTVSTMLRGGESGAVLVRGHAERSYFLEMIDSGEMPPEGEKRLAKEEIALLRRWVQRGAPADERIVLPSATDFYRDEHRQHWAFQRPAQGDPPMVQQQKLVRTPIDAFVLQRLEAAGRSFVPRARRATLARRAWFDLTGLPPTPTQLDAFLADDSPKAFDRIVDRLLDSPAYGQRWARHWLDVARYADYYDANPKTRTASSELTEAWRYRDWVVDSLNRDLPFDRFIVHQIAGDLLPDPSGGEIYPDGLVATTFLSNGVWDRGDADKEKIVSDMVDDQIDTIGKAFLGLALGCARCHDHKFDPVSQEDYYALAGMFYSTHMLKSLGAKGGEYDVKRVPLVGPSVIARRNQQMQQLSSLKKQLADFDKEKPKPPADDPRRLKLMAERDKLQAELLPETPLAMAVQEGGTPGGLFPGIQDVPIHIRGSYTRLGRIVPRRLPIFFVGDSQPSIAGGSGRRELARWVASKENPLTARVIVNRVWQWHFGEGLVRTPNNFGMRSRPPSHPELLDWLAQRFIADGWSLKKLHRHIMLSATYQQSSQVPREQVEGDPENRLLGRFAPRRLEAEAIRDAMLFVAGQLDSSPGGPAGDDLNIRRRSLYVQTARWNRSNFATLFDAANPDASTAKRSVSTVAPQSLFLLNNDFTLTQARHLAKRILVEAARDDDARIDRVYRLLFGRPATKQERAIARTIIAPSDKQTTESAWTDLAHVLLCCNEFVYLD